jgi:hypothetical protein
MTHGYVMNHLGQAIKSRKSLNEVPYPIHRILGISFPMQVLNCKLKTLHALHAQQSVLRSLCFEIFPILETVR